MTKQDRTLFLHIGHQKTGSSYLQSAFALSRDALGEQEIAYPRPASEARARAGGITSGNGNGLISAMAKAPRDKNLFLSSELLFDELTFGERLAPVTRQAKKHGFDRISFLLFIRDPVDHASSRYQQWVKRRGETRPLAAIYEAYDVPSQVADFLDRIETDDYYRITVSNYSRSRRRLRSVAEDWLGIPAATLLSPPIEQVNRSLTRAELEFQRRLNMHFGKCGWLYSDHLCEKLPHIEAETPYPAEEIQQAMCDRLAPAIARVNARIGPEEGYRTKPRPATDTDEQTYSFTPDQLDIAAQALRDALGPAPRAKHLAANALRYLARGDFTRIAGAIRNELSGMRPQSRP